MTIREPQPLWCKALLRKGLILRINCEVGECVVLCFHIDSAVDSPSGDFFFSLMSVTPGNAEGCEKGSVWATKNCVSVPPIFYS